VETRLSEHAGVVHLVAQQQVDAEQVSAPAERGGGDVLAEGVRPGRKRARGQRREREEQDCRKSSHQSSLV